MHASQLIVLISTSIVINEELSLLIDHFLMCVLYSKHEDTSFPAKLREIPVAFMNLSKDGFLEIYTVSDIS